MDLSSIRGLFLVTLRIDYSLYLSKIFQARLLHDLERQVLIRATKETSRRPNHMHSHLDALQAMAPVNLRRVASEVHSVAKQASFYIALGAHFQGFWRAKWLPKFDF